MNDNEPGANMTRLKEICRAADERAAKLTPYVDDRSDAELFEAEAERTMRDLKERLAMRNARCAELTVALERLLEVVEANGYDAHQSRAVNGARRALGLSHEEESPEGGF